MTKPELVKKRLRKIICLTSYIDTRDGSVWGHDTEIANIKELEDEAYEIIKPLLEPLPLPEKDCAYLGTCDDGRIICDGAGDDVSPQFCAYCRYISKTYGFKPREFAEKLFKLILSISPKIK